MNYLMNFVIFTTAVMLICTINDLMQIKVQRRIGLAKRPWRLLIRHLPGYFNSILTVLILFISVIFSCDKMSNSKEYVLIPLLLIFITKVISPKKGTTDIYFEAISVAAILISLMPHLLNNNTLPWVSFVASAISVKIFNKNTHEQLPLSRARNIALNCYIFAVYLPNTDLNITIFLSVLLAFVQDTIYILVPKFNETSNMRMAFILSLSSSLFAFILNSIVAIFIGR